MIATLLAWLRDALEVMGGARPMKAPETAKAKAGGVVAYAALGAWWVVLFLVVFATIGRATKFIYVDF